ncbi:hypothetical protein T484DRAFT_1976265 [Baffinella frigidus]|nr:hypothetical protein T484DRAFT_1976265 [Cryptophyta sp. CCMP2293]|mmetsp:Transcript_29866/g.69530  ORF Transcript_29866/g.69530 Transcript_29866/m.69530 type:complete len:215 (-) Transcript_29866:110-754(-)
MCNIPCPFSAPLCPTPPAESSLPSRPPPDSAGVSHAGHTLPPLTYTDTPGSTPSPHDEDARPWTVPRSSSHLHLHPLPPEETHPTPKDKGAGASLDGTENGDRQKACAPAPVARPVDRRLEGVEEGATRAPELHFRRGEGHRIDLVAHLAGDLTHCRDPVRVWRIALLVPRRSIIWQGSSPGWRGLRLGAAPVPQICVLAVVLLLQDARHGGVV